MSEVYKNQWNPKNRSCSSSRCSTGHCHTHMRNVVTKLLHSGSPRYYTAIEFVFKLWAYIFGDIGYLSSQLWWSLIPGKRRSASSFPQHSERIILSPSLINRLRFITGRFELNFIHPFVAHLMAVPQFDILPSHTHNLDLGN